MTPLFDLQPEDIDAWHQLVRGVSSNDLPLSVTACMVAMSAGSSVDAALRAIQVLCPRSAELINLTIQLNSIVLSRMESKGRPETGLSLLILALHIASVRDTNSALADLKDKS